MKIFIKMRDSAEVVSNEEEYSSQYGVRTASTFSTLNQTQPSSSMGVFLHAIKNRP